MSATYWDVVSIRPTYDATDELIASCNATLVEPSMGSRHIMLCCCSIAPVRAEKYVEGEKGARTFSLRKAMNDNTHFFAYGTWDKMEDFHAHIE